MKATRRFIRNACAVLILLLAASISHSGVPGEFAILYTTDVHGHIMTDGETIGLDTIAAIRKSVPDAILVDAGDFLHGTPAATLTKGRDVVELMKRAGYTATAVGNHEFNYGRSVLEDRAREASGPSRPMTMLAANIRRADGGDLFIPWTVIERNGLRIGLFGITTLDAVYQSAPGAVAGLEFGDPVEVARHAVRKLRDMGCDLVVALTHIETGESLEMARAIDGLDIIVGGHSHAVVDEVVNGTAVISSGCHGKNIGLFEVRRDADGMYRTTNRIIPRSETDSVEPDAFLSMRMGMIRDDQERLLSEVVGYSDVDLIGDREMVRTRETNLGNLIADAVAASTGSDIAIVNGGTIRATIPGGEITKGHVLTTFPFSNIAMSKVVTGAQLRDILEVAFSRMPVEDGRFPQIAGLRVTVDRGSGPGGRVRSIEFLDGRTFDESAVYSLGTNDFLAEGGDEYPHLKDLPIERISASMEEVFLSYIEEHGTAGYAQTEQKEPSRIIFER